LKAEGHPFGNIADAARRLDRFYIAARYPNGLPGACPFQAYTAGDLNQAEADARVVVETSQVFVQARIGP
jgi:HEPN domain-containing protein